MEYSLKKDAIEFRNELGYGNTEALNFNNLLIKLDVIAVFKKLSNSFSGMAVKTTIKNFILINSNHSIGRQNFSVCHELYHLYKDDNFTPHHSFAGSFNIKKKNEFCADVFASYFLLPDDGLLSLIPDSQLKKDTIQIETILKIEHYFSCSRSALLYRLKELELISSKFYDHYSQTIIRNARLNGYSTELYEPGNDGKVIGDYGIIAKSLYDEERISEGHYFSLMTDIGINVYIEMDNGSYD